MKKLTFLFVLTLSVCISMAQNNSSSVGQTGNENQAEVLQTGMFNSGIVGQTGDKNNALIKHGNFGGGNVQANYAQAEISQIGDINNAEVLQRGGWSGATAVSTHTVSQTGDNNSAWLTTFNEGNQGAIKQVGDVNWAMGRQSNNGSIISIDQNGENNYANAEQLGSPQSDASILQTGDWNRANVDQDGIGNIAVSKVESGDVNHVDVNQDGNSNEATVEIGKWGKSDNNIVNLTQVGIKNNLQVYANTSDYNEVNATQAGDNNYFRVQGIKGDDNTVDLNVTGNSNRGSWDISAAWPVYSDGNDLDITQNGNKNFTTGKIAGDANDVDINQTSSNNLVGSDWYMEDGVVIMGDQNTVGISQQTMGNSSLNSITGNGNTVSVIQN